MRKIFFFIAVIVCAASMNAQEPLPGDVLQYGKFSVSNSKQVLFSKGNLQYNSHEDQFRFAENQYDIVGATNAQIGSDVDEWMDLFGWATSHYNNTDPFLNILNNSLYGDGNNDIADTDYDWGVYNKDDLSAPAVNWRTLTAEEWDYLIFTRSSTLVGYATIAGVKGLVLLEDDWTVCPEGLTFKDVTESTAWTANVYDADQWYQMEVFGAIFLPAAGYREEATVNAYEGNYAFGGYWSATHYGTAETQACALSFSKDEINGDAFSNDPKTVNNPFNRYQGNSVRLVIDYEAPAAQQFTVTLVVNPDPSGNADFTNGDLTGVYDEGDEVRIQASGNAEWLFEGWDTDEDGVPDNAAEELVFNIYADITITAFFTPVGGGLGIDDVNDGVRVRKSLIDGQLLIEKNGKIFNAQGAQIQ